MIKPQNIPFRLIGLLILVLTGLSCNTEEAKEELLIEETFFRRPFESKLFEGAIEEEPVSMRLRLVKDVLEGELVFEKTQVRKKVQGKLSYEGIFRATAFVEGVDLEEEDFLPSTLKGVFVNANRIVGTYTKELQNELGLIDLGVFSKERFSVVEKEEAIGGIEMTHWLRTTPCIQQSGDTLGLLKIEIPMLRAPRVSQETKWLYQKMVESLVYNSRCTCKALARKKAKDLYIGFEIGTQDEISISWILRGLVDGQQAWKQEYRFDLNGRTQPFL